MTVRELFINWLTASRFIKTLEMNVMVQRSDFLDRLLEKDGLIKQLRAELAASKLECDRMRTVLMVPWATPSARELRQSQAVVPEFSGPDDWMAELNKAIRQQEEADGVSGERREVIHEQTADDGA
jgi:hypothetical protein